METKVDWDKTFASWRPSHGAELVSDPEEIDAIIRILQTYSDAGKRLQYFASKDSSVAVTKNNLQKDGLGDYELLEILLAQISEHRRIWNTHLEDKDRKTVETGFKPPAKDVLRYVKFQFNVKGKSWKNPKTVKEIFINYHDSTIEVKVIYEEKKS